MCVTVMMVLVCSYDTVSNEYLPNVKVIYQLANCRTKNQHSSFQFVYSFFARWNQFISNMNVYFYLVTITVFSSTSGRSDNEFFKGMFLGQQEDSSKARTYSKQLSLCRMGLVLMMLSNPNPSCLTMGEHMLVTVFDNGICQIGNL